jgi:hypothetical protein
MTNEALLAEAKRTYSEAYEHVIEGDASKALSGLELAAASLHLWRQVGTAKNEAIGLWMLSRALLKVGARDAAVEAGERSLSIAKEISTDWMIASALEALTRATLGTQQHEAYRARAIAAIDSIADAEDREHISSQFADLR